MVELKAYDNGSDIVFAHDADEAFRIWLKTTGERPEDYDLEAWREMDASKTFTVHSDDGPTVTMRLAEWIAERPEPRYFASRDY